MDARLDLNGLEVIKDVFYLIQDLARGVIIFDTDTQVKGDLGLLLFKIPINVSHFFLILISSSCCFSK